MPRDQQHDWMLVVPDERLPAAVGAVFERVESVGEAALFDAPATAHLPRWLLLQWLARRGWLLHGSDRAGIERFEPRRPDDRSPDDFSKQTAVFASSDGVWALMYALRDRDRVTGMLNMAVQPRTGDGWGPMRYYLSLASDVPVRSGRSLLRPGHVHVLTRDGFRRMPPYTWPGVGEVLEPHWARTSPVVPAPSVPVTPDDLPIEVRTHDTALVARRARADPWGFPWLDEGG